MSFSSLLDHRVSIVRQVSVLALGEPTYDVYNQPVTTPETTTDIPAAIQPIGVRNASREVAAVSNAGVAIADYTIFMHTRDISTADAVVHDPAECPKADGADLPAARFSLVGVRNPTGRGHHLSLDAKLIDTPLSGAEGS
jgi:hypothetical protein